MMTSTMDARRSRASFGRGSFGCASVFLLGLIGVAALSSAPVLAGPDEEDDAQRIEQGREALKKASAFRRSSNGKDVDERFEILNKAGADYEDLARDYAGVTVVAGEAWFRAGEIWRTLRRNEQASTCFTQAAAAEEGGEFGARAQLELGHMSRRAKHLEAALERYTAVEGRFAAQRRQGVQARTWRGKVELLRENVEDGHRLLLSVGEDYPEFAVEHVRNADIVAVDWCEAGRLGEARTLIDSVRSRHGTPREGEELPEEVAEALAKMKAPALLEAAEKEGGSRGDGDRGA